MVVGEWVRDELFNKVEYVVMIIVVSVILNFDEMLMKN